MSDDRFDTLETARDLEATGIERPHAEVIARAVGHAVAPLATKADVQRLETTLRSGFERSQVATKDDMDQRFGRHEAWTKTEFERHDASTKAEFERHDASTKAEFERHDASTKAEFERHEAWTKTEFERHGVSTKSDSERLEARLRSDFERSQSAIRSDMDQRFERHETWTRVELANLRADMYRALWIQGAGIVAVVAALKLLP